MRLKLNNHSVPLAVLTALTIFLSGCGYSALEPGNPMPKLAAEGWTNGTDPDVVGKVVVIEAFATW